MNHKLVGTYNEEDFNTILKPIVLDNLYEDEYIVVLKLDGGYEIINGDKKREEENHAKNNKV